MGPGSQRETCLGNGQMRSQNSTLLAGARAMRLLATSTVKGKGKVFPYSLPSVGPGADPGVQAVSPQVT